MRKKLRSMGLLTVGCLLVVVIAMIGAVVPEAVAQDVVVPASTTFTNFRGEAQNYLSSVYYYEGTTLRFTNCVLYAGEDTNSVRQGLADTEVEIRVGSVTTNTPHIATASDTNNGVWWVEFLIPSDLASTYVQVKVTDTNDNSYIYPWKILRTKDALE